ncbi:hypothetical protein GCM10011386_30010 [Parapedobacter defluvii]|uniref:NACHT domain-containing protein n=1 Tax=Parapedobacter defluvii TaxID=2045106 RepID=A0ABQ1MDZ6_9SPHI|nr:hypothetical protein [Parapedobacter defluvii]GGC35869.1 hypothetical protein GCM10011386_30010 [Parapedobacter defluvii]
MQLVNLNTYSNAPERAFETLCSQLFENWVKRQYDDISYFSVVNGAGGDGGVEAYARRGNGQIVGLQAKWFLKSIGKGQISQIENSIKNALAIRPDIRHYIICIPRDNQSMRRGQRGKVLTETEESKLNDLQITIESSYDGLKIEYWFETRIITEMGHPANEGLIRFWFEKEAISFDTLTARFEEAKAGWLSDRYFPELHNKDTISKIVNEVTISDQYLKKELESVQEVFHKLETSVNLLSSFLDVPLDDDLKGKLIALVDNLKLTLVHYRQLSQEIERNCVNSVFEYDEFSIYPITRKLSEARVPNRLREDKIKLCRLLDELHRIHLPQYLNSFHERFQAHNYIILGPAGTGKTHALAFEVEERLRFRLPSLLIRAKDCKNLNWKMILSDSLQACSDWSVDQLFSALSSMARGASVSRAAGEKDKWLNHQLKFLICVDGIDECDDPAKWGELIHETKVWIERFPNIAFLFSCRNYPPTNQDPFSLHRNDERIKRQDVYSADLHVYYNYLEHFNIKYDKTPWIIYSFENALSARLFCEEYKGKDLTDLFPNPVFNTTWVLLGKKIERMEREYLNSVKDRFSINDHLVGSTLQLISRYFTEEKSIDRTRLRKLLYNDLEQVLPLSDIGHLLDKLIDNGFLLSHSTPSNDGLTYRQEYEPGIQSFFDYLLAARYTETIVQGKLKNVPELILEERFAYVRELIALGLLTDHNQLVGQDGLWTNDLNESELLQLQFKVLSKVSKKLYQQFEPFLQQLFIIDRDRFVEYFVLPNANREDLNIVENIIHKTLLAFPSLYERDQFWSGPDDHDIEGHSHLSLVFEYRTLFILSKPKQEPLLFSWVLSTTSNIIRDKIKADLTSWALNEIEGFVALLDVIFFPCQDAQIQEELAGVMYGLATLIDGETENVDRLVVWIQDNIFHPEQIVKIRNSVIRHACRCFMEKAYHLGICEEKDYKDCVPPYSKGNDLLKYHPDGFISRDGIYPIERDLYWNSIEDAFRNFVEYQRGGIPNTEMKNLLIEHKSTDSPKDFFTRVALQYIKDIGWNKADGFADIGHRQFRTFEQKYLISAVHEIQGYLADRLPFYEGSNKSFLDDYGRILHINNPAHKELVKLEYLSSDKIGWFVPEDFSPELNYTTSTIKQDIKQWTTANFVYDFEKWLHPNKLNLFHEKDKVIDDWLTLDSHLAMPEPNGIGRTWLKISCLLIDAADQRHLTSLLNEIDGEKIRFATDHLNAGIRGHVYNSLLDVIWRKQIEEHDTEIMLAEKNGIVIEAYPTTTELVEQTATQSDIHFKFPSKFLRELLAINQSDKVSYFDRNRRVKAISHSTYENPDLQQKLLIADRNGMESALKEHGLVPVWVCKEFRSTMTSNSIVDKNQAHWQNCRIWFVLMEQSNCKAYLIHSNYYDL